MDSGAAELRRLTERVRAAYADRVPLEIRGGATKRFYGNPPRGEPLEVGPLAGITSYEPTELVVSVLGGTPLAELEDALGVCGQRLAFEPPRFGAATTVGGMVAAGLAGPARARSGPVRDYVLGATLLNGSAQLMTFGGQVMKNVAGYDLSRVLAGSLGTLGVICEVSLKVLPLDPAGATRCIEVDEAASLDLLNRWAGAAVPVTASTWSEGRLMVRLGGAHAAIADAARSVGGSEVEPSVATRWWSDVRDQRLDFFSLDDAALGRGECLWRLSLPDTAPPIDLPGIRFLEWGGALRWWRTAAPPGAVRDAAAAAGGHATLFRSADKSAGAFAAVTPPLMQLHRRIKQAFDPKGIFNPGRLYCEL